MPEAEVVAEIEAVFIQNPFGLTFSAIIIGTAIIKDAVEATVQIGFAERTLCLPADEPISGNFFFTARTDFHGCKNTGNVRHLSSEFHAFMRSVNAFCLLNVKFPP